MTTVLIVVAGLIATAVMTGALYLIHWRGFANADMLRAVGSLFTRSEANALGVGVIVHLISGVVFAYLYVLLWSSLPPQMIANYPLLGIVTGLAHGLVVSFALVVLVAEHHPLPRFQRAGMGVAVAHLAGHVVYGLVVGLLAQAWGLQLAYVGQVAG